MLPHLEVMLQNSTGATMLLRYKPDDPPVESVLVQVEPTYARAVLFDVPEGWMQRRMVLHCELYADSGVLAFIVPAIAIGHRAIEFPRPHEVALLKQRETVRVPCDLSVRLLQLGLPPHAPDPNRPGQHHRLVDISGGGAALQTPHPLEVGQQFSLQFTAAKWRNVGEVPVTVVHVLKQGPPAVYGLAFGTIPPRQRTTLNGLVADLIRAHRHKRREEARRWLR